MKTFTSADFIQWGSIGGKKSKRKLTREQSLAMIAVREAKRKKK